MRQAAQPKTLGQTRDILWILIYFCFFLFLKKIFSNIALTKTQKMLHKSIWGKLIKSLPSVVAGRNQWKIICVLYGAPVFDSIPGAVRPRYKVWILGNDYLKLYLSHDFPKTEIAIIEPTDQTIVSLMGFQSIRPKNLSTRKANTVETDQYAKRLTKVTKRGRSERTLAHHFFPWEQMHFRVCWDHLPEAKHNFDAVCAVVRKRHENVRCHSDVVAWPGRKPQTGQVPQRLSSRISAATARNGSKTCLSFSAGRPTSRNPGKQRAAHLPRRLCHGRRKFPSCTQPGKRWRACTLPVQRVVPAQGGNGDCAPAASPNDNENTKRKAHGQIMFADGQIFFYQPAGENGTARAGKDAVAVAQIICWWWVRRRRGGSHFSLSLVVFAFLLL